MTKPDLSLEKREIGHIAGIDEVGRGPFAGPVIAAAVILDPNNIPEGIQDSKKLTKKVRETLFDQILQSSSVGIGEASSVEIDTLNILQATFVAMNRALSALDIRPDVALVDGNRDPKLGISTRLVVKGDSISLSIAAASIVAKVTRDRKMCVLAKEFPHYGWEKNAGYGTLEHRKGLSLFGITPQHRRSFAPIRKILESNETPI